MKHLTAICLLAAALFAAGCSSQSAPPQTSAASPVVSGPIAGDPTAGKTQYAGTCVACHGPDARGIKGLGKDLVDSKFVDGLTAQQLAEFVKKGRPTSDPANTTKVDMPPKGGNPALSDQAMADIAAFLKSL